MSGYNLSGGLWRCGGVPSTGGDWQTELQLDAEKIKPGKETLIEHFVFIFILLPIWAAICFWPVTIFLGALSWVLFVLLK